MSAKIVRRTVSFAPDVWQRLRDLHDDDAWIERNVKPARRSHSAVVQHLVREEVRVRGSFDESFRSYAHVLVRATASILAATPSREVIRRSISLPAEVDDMLLQLRDDDGLADHKARAYERQRSLSSVVGYVVIKQHTMWRMEAGIEVEGKSES